MTGYNILFELDGKTVAGETDSNLAISPQVKESLYKKDKGNKRRVVTGHDVTFSINGSMYINDDGTSTELDSDEIIAMSLKKGDEAVFPFIYRRDTGKSYKGEFIITGYTETPNADGNATFSLNCSISGDMTPVTE